MRGAAPGDGRGRSRIRRWCCRPQARPGRAVDPSGKLVYTRGSEVLTSTLQTAAEDATPDSATTAYTPMPPYNPLMGGSSLSSEMENISSIQLSRGGTRRLDPGYSFAWADDSNTYTVQVQEGKLKSKVYRIGWYT